MVLQSFLFTSMHIVVAGICFVLAWAYLFQSDVIRPLAYSSTQQKACTTNHLACISVNVGTSLVSFSDTFLVG
jgi:hypothetical protein